MIITPQTIIYGSDKSPVVFPYHGLRRESFNGGEIEDLRAGGYDWYIYEQPSEHDPKLNRLDGLMVLGSYTCTEGCIDLTPKELQANIDKQNSSTKTQRSSLYIKESDPLFFYWMRGEGTEQYWLDEVAKIRTGLPYI